MSSDDPLLALVAARNPVPDPDAPSAEQHAPADEVRQRVHDLAEPPRRTKTRRNTPWRHLIIAAAAVLPVAVVVAIAFGIHASRHAVPSSATDLPQTILVIGSDHTGTAPYRTANTDTMILIRLDPSSKTVNVLSVPRDLEVHLPNGVAKLNAAYSEGGPNLLVKTIRQQLFPRLSISHVLDVNLAGFVDAVNALGCIDADIDHHYYLKGLTSNQSIDIEPGYQTLCGQDALQFVRYRNTDSDAVRTARLEDLMRWTSQSQSVADLRSDLNRLIAIEGSHVQIDAGLPSPPALKGLKGLIDSMLGRPLNEIPFPTALAPCPATRQLAPCYLTATPSAEAAAYQQLITPTSTPPPTSPPATPQDNGSSVASPGLMTDPAVGQAQAAALGGVGFPVLYPDRIATGSGYCSTAARNCGQTSPQTYSDAYPRRYDIKADGRTYPAYRMTLAIRPALGEYYGVQGTTWTNPPILDNPTRTQVVNGKKLLEFFNDRKLSMVALKTANAVYWVSNTLTDTLSNGQLVAIAASLRSAR